ncbi:MAG: hypothetical protein WCI64_09590 [Chlorobium sp.]
MMISDGITCGHAYTIALESTTVAILMREAGRGGNYCKFCNSSNNQG